MNLTAASAQWSSRPASERYVSLTGLYDRVANVRRHSQGKVIANRDLSFAPDIFDEAHKGLKVTGAKGSPADMTHWAFNQLASLAGAPAKFLRDLPAPIVADALNYCIRFKRDVEEIGLLITRDDQDKLLVRAATGPNYGRVWNEELIKSFVQVYGDGTREGGGRWQVPGEFRVQTPITPQNTTFYGDDRSVFIFLADEQNIIEIPNRRNGAHGPLARGIFAWNSEVGSDTIGAAFFYYDYTCMNRIVWDVSEYTEIRLRHTAGAPKRWIEEISPAIQAFANSSDKGVVETIKAAQATAKADELDAFLAKRFTRPELVQLKAAHEREEGRPIESIWDAVTGVTAWAKTYDHQEERVSLERRGGALLNAVAA